jgi:hypothetical protein
MNEFFEKIKSIGSEIDAEVGGVALFGVFKPAETPQRWDVIVSADWVGEDNTPAIYYVGRRLQERLDVEELVSLSRIEALPPSNDFVRSVLDAVRVTDEGAYFEYRAFNGILMTQAYIAIANPDSHSHTSLPVSTAQIRARASIRSAADKTKSRTGTSTKPRKR